ncbi:type II toxin-antitoxin system ChpB family toxin [Herbaspirillum sp. RTI4]|uniref:type II toxin-antitoxin system ChpB family toxin n=1 Tax=Herbaspirillum sp. RTI4 TaxID=3048640 RepID=UPI002AB4C190|nr:type II toxin-antitoxin system ChpB family toxin [Herbaspirillum sp. RTI4]MDY7577965.1 type II toxin-antitoxin system ChpB family toxin [Herbaspirillum sp. RTI4]MEA9981589.1 type II toxin-antitoxin system ChpB family toxin [Herbaspirillum sp. RTI4]
MVRRIKYERGDIVIVSLNPTQGRELQGDQRPGLILSPASFNALGVAMVAPITQGGDFARFAGFAVPLNGSGSKTQGVALLNQVRMLDLEARGAKKIETVPGFVIEDALARLQAILE